MNIKMKTMFPAVIGVTAGAVVGFVSKRKRKRSAEIKELLYSIKCVLDMDEVKNFIDYARYLEEYYNITVMRMLETDGENVYHSPKFSKPISSTEIIRSIWKRLPFEKENGKEIVVCCVEAVIRKFQKGKIWILNILRLRLMKA